MSLAKFAAAAAALAVASPLAAEARDLSRTVSYTDLDLQNERDAQVLHARIVEAAKKVCTNEGVLGVAGVQLRRACLEQAIDRAVAEAGLESLSRVHAERFDAGAKAKRSVVAIR